MNRLVLLLATLSGATFLTACGDAEILVHAQQIAVGDGSSEEALALRDLPIKLVPYDRDALFDSLQAAYPVPQPAIPDSLLAMREAMAAAQAEWNEAEHTWGIVRDSLAKISRSLEGLSRTSGDYRLLFRDFQELEPQEATLRKRSDSAFARFTSMQSQVAAQSEEIRILREQWEDEAFEPVDLLIYNRLKELKRTEVSDTTTAAGVAQFKVQPGKWWVTARYELPYQELYWNIPVDVERGAPLEIRLTRENAIVRPKL